MIPAAQRFSRITRCTRFVSTKTTAVCLLAGLAACSAHTITPPPASTAPRPGVPVDAPAPEPSDAGADDATSAVLRSTADGDYLGVIDRAGLTSIVEQGLGRLLGRLQLSPDLNGTRFRGFRIVALDPAWSGSGVLTGDIIMRLNGQPIERPEQAMLAFDALRVASEVAVEIVRDGKPMRLRYRVE